MPIEPKPLLEEEVTKFTGINNRKNYSDLSINELYLGTNIDISMQNDISTRDGLSMTKSGNYKWGKGFDNIGVVLAIKDNNLVVLDHTLTTEAILRNNVGDTRMVYVYHSGKVFYTNSTVIGYIYNNTNYSFPTPDREYRSNPLPGQCLEVHGFRLWIAHDNELWFTDVGKFHSVDMRRNIRQMQSKITMLKSIGRGMFISDSLNTYYVEGNNPYKMPLVKVKTYPAIEGDAITVDGQLIKEGIPSQVAIWTSIEGICIGMEGGQVLNITELNYDFPSCNSSTSLYRFKNDLSQFITTLVS